MCSLCSTCEAGTSSYTLDSVKAAFSLGKRANGLPAGSLYFHEQDPGVALSTPAGLKIAAYSGITTKLSGTALRQVKADTVLADIVTTSATTWEIRFYAAPAQVGPVGGDGLYNQTGKTAYHTVAFDAQSAGSVFDRLVVTEAGDLGNRRYDYVWQDTGTAKSWTLQFPDATAGILRQEQVTRGKDAQDRTTKTTSVLDSAGTALSRITETSQKFDWGEEVVLESTAHLDSTGASLGADQTRTHVYYTTTDVTTGALSGRLAESYEDDGAKWVQYQYDSAGRVTRRREQFGDAARDAADSACRVTDFSYTATAPDASGSATVTTVETRSLLGQVVSRHLEVWWAGTKNATNPSTGGYNYRSKWSAVAADLTLTDPTAILAAPGTLITKSRYYDASSGSLTAGRECSSLTPDGQLRITEYSSDGLTTSVYTGTPDAAGNKITAGFKTITVKNVSGGLVAESTYSVQGATSTLIAQSVATTWDSFGRPTNFSYLDGTTSSQSFDCCGLQSETDRQGISTVYERDSLKRVRSQTRAGLTTRFTLDALGRTTATQRTGADSSSITQQSVNYRSDGLTLSSTDALNRTTTVAESTDSDGHRVVTTTYPGSPPAVSLSTRIETYAKDGSLLSVAGTAVAPMKYGYGVDADGSFVKEIRLALSPSNGLGADTGSGPAETEWSKTYTDFAGRPSKTVTPASTSTSFFNSSGQLVRTVDPDGVQSLYDYDSLGRRTTTALDLDRDGVIDFDGTDRITRTTTSYLTAHSTTCERTVTETWSTDNSATASTIATTDRSVDGLRTWTTVPGSALSPAEGLTTVTTVAYPTIPDGTRTETTTAPDGTTATRTYAADRLVSEAHCATNGTVLEATNFRYDPHGRLVESRRYTDPSLAASDLQPSGFSLQPSDSRVLATTTTYFDDDQPHTVTTPAPSSVPSPASVASSASVSSVTPSGSSASGTSTSTSTSYEYDSAGRLWKTLLPDLTETVREYFPTGRLKKTYGSRTYPQEYTYDSQGRIQTLTTWQNFASGTGAAITTWTYDPARGWLTGKTYADNTGPTYTYWPSGRLHTRTWARTVAGQPLVTTYSFNNAGDLATIDYSDTTPDVAFGYDRLGRRTTTTDAAGTLVTTYEGLTAATDDETYAADPGVSESNPPPLLPALAVTRTRDSLLRPAGLAAEVTSPKVQVTSVGYSYNPQTGRLETVSATENGTTTDHTYAYQPNSSLIHTLTQSRAGTTVLTTTRTYDRLNRLSAISSASAPSVTQSVSSAAYEYNNANQRTRLTREDSAYWSYGYDSLGQVTAAAKHLPDATPALAADFAFTFDDIGNRLSSSQNTNPSFQTPNSAPETLNLKLETYTANALNQYTQRTVPPVVDVLGSAHPDATVTVNFQPTTRQGALWAAQLTVDNASAPVYTAARVIGVRSSQGPNGEDAVAEETRHAYVAQTPEQFEYDLDGNLTSDGRWTYTWDAENRLVSMEAQAAAVTAGVPKQKLEFAYDSTGRRIQKKVSEWNGSAYIVASDTRFLYDGWNLLAELNGLASNAVVRSYVWGLDLSGSMQGAGGVGGLLAVNSGGATFLPAYDGNGNLVALVDAASSTCVAEYEHGPFGEPLRVTGPAADANPFRFSTKYTDTETGLVMYPRRPYSPMLGRFLSRDPIEEEGGVNLYGFVGNDPVDTIDPLGEDFIAVGTRPLAGIIGFIAGGWGSPANHMSMEYYSGCAKEGTSFTSSKLPQGATRKDARELLQVDGVYSRLVKTKKETVGISFIYSTSTARDLVVIYDAQDADVKWQTIVTTADSYTYAEHGAPGSALRNWPNSKYGLPAHKNSNNSNTFARVLAKAIGKNADVAPGFHPGSNSPAPVSDTGTVPQP